MDSPTTHHRLFRRAATACCGLLALVCAACSTVHAPDSHIVPPDEPALSAPVVKYRVAFMPLVVEGAFKEHLEETKQSPRVFAYVVPPELRRQLIEETVTAMQQVGAFDDVKFLPGAEGREMPGVLQDAWNSGFDVVARPVLKRHDCLYVGQNGNYVPAMLLWWLTLPISSWWIGDETFASEVEIAIEFFSTAEPTGAPFAERRVVGRVECDLNDFDQGFNFFNIFITPGGLSDGHWEDIGNNLLPLSRLEVQRQTVAKSRDTADGFATDFAAASDRLRKTLAVVVGASPGAGRAPRFAEDDVQAVRRMLVQDIGEPLADDRTMVVLDGLRATRAGLLRAVDDLLVGHAREGDRVFVFLAVRGLIATDGTAYLLMADTSPERLAETAVALDDLRDALAALPAPVVVMAAVAWEFADEKAAAAGPTANPWDGFASAENVLVFAATDSGTPVELDQPAGSLFVSEFVTAVRNSAATDANSDGWLTWQEMADAIRDPITRVTRFDGFPQVPVLAGAKDVQSQPFFKTGTRSGNAGAGPLGDSTTGIPTDPTTNN